jgi:hypothetical protein
MSKNGNKTIDPLFDGHLEKNILQMTPSERMDYLLMFIDLRVLANIAKENKENIKHKDE